MSSEVDLVIPFRAFPNHSLSKRQTRDLARKAEKEYGRLIDTLTYSGLRAVGRRGESLGHILVFVSCPESLLNTLRKREGLPPPLAPADRLRLVYKFVTAPPADGGLGIVPTPGEWDLVEDAMLLHDKEFNDNWIRTWTRKMTTEGQLARIRDMFGDSTALYFAFLRAYTTSLALPATLGGIFYFLEKPYHPAYAFCLLIYSTLFTEYWRVAERVFTARFSPPESFPQSASKNGPASALTRDKALRQSTSGITWWRRDLRVLASFPIIALCAAALVILITSIFVYEAFITQLYAGPGRKIVAFTPTIMFVLLIPRFLAVYRKLATSLTSWENHSVRRSSASIDSVNTYENALATSRAKQAHAASLTLKTFVLTSLVSYLGLFLSAFVYVPFGEEVMHAVQVWIAGVDVRNSRFGSVVEKLRSLGLNDTLVGTLGSHSSSLHAKGGASSIWETDILGARQKLNPSRLTDQMFACVVTNQLSQNFNEIGLPFILRFIEKKPWKKTARASQ
ncbi:hypothetical protein ONZ45_g8349 [Pleurotus djamor]|nr:hypothetical protein ONZ45_g8349 [Pleurotus djamor]